LPLPKPQPSFVAAAAPEPADDAFPAAPAHAASISAQAPTTAHAKPTLILFDLIRSLL
jgi:hypothetical protein